MAADLIVAPEAEDDIAAAYAWYEDRRMGLGEDFLVRVDAAVGRLCRDPEGHAVIYKGYRRALVRRYPYAIIYEYADDQVTVYAVSHTASDPEKWRRRLP
jgi:toxin ParE1/3/4